MYILFRESRECPKGNDSTMYTEYDKNPFIRARSRKGQGQWYTGQWENQYQDICHVYEIFQGHP